MGNIKCKRVKITQSEPVAEETNNERIRTLKTDVSDVNSSKDAQDESRNSIDENKEKDHDNASSASTVEVLDDK